MSIEIHKRKKKYFRNKFAVGIGTAVLTVSLAAGTCFGAGITDEVPEADPSVQQQTESFMDNAMTVEHGRDEKVNVFEDAGRIDPLPEVEVTKTPDPVPEGDSVSNDQLALLQQEAGIRGCIVRIRTGYEFDDGSFDEWTNGTGFLIGKDCVLTARSIAVVSQDSTLYRRILSEKGSGYKQLGIDLTDISAVKNSVRIYVIGDNGPIESTVNERAGGDAFAILSLSSRINAYGTVSFATAMPASGDEVNALSTEAEESENALTADDFYIRKGEVIGSRKSGDSNYVEFNGDFSSLTPGCPLVDSQQNVIGLITDGTAGRGSAVDALTIERVLDSVNIEYDTASGNEEGGDIYKLSSLIEEADTIDRTLYTQESLAVYDKAIEEATAVTLEDSPSKNRVAKTCEEVEAAKAQLTLVDHSGEYIRYAMMAGAGVVVLILLIVLIRILKNKGKEDWEIEEEKQAKREAKERKKMGKKEPAKKEKPAKAKKASNDNTKNTVVGRTMDDRNIAESVEALDDDTEGETTVLKENDVKAYLINERTGERILVDGNDFIIGKSSKGTQYKISGNDTVSRKHCCIHRRGGTFAVEDLKSLNGTYVDDKRVEPQQQERLYDRSSLKLSDEEFIFRIGEE